MLQPGVKLLAGPWNLSFGDFKKFGLIFLIEGFLGSLFFIYGVSNSSLAVGSAMTSLSPVVSVFALWIFLRQRPSGTTLLGIVTTIVGIVLLLSNYSSGV
jgi:drug/metabolite transporter (DMT)-like permease